VQFAFILLLLEILNMNGHIEWGIFYFLDAHSSDPELKAGISVHMYRERGNC
jgi:hypothetical protein